MSSTESKLRKIHVFPNEDIYKTNIESVGENDLALIPILNGHILGETIESLIPLTDAGIHLFDGALITSGGVYDGFVQYINRLFVSQNLSPKWFFTEEQWQDCVAKYGVCSKFVVSTSGVRLPKLYSETRYLVKSWKEGTEWYNLYSDGWCEQGGRITNSGSSGTAIFPLEFKDTNFSIATVEGATTTLEANDTDTGGYADNMGITNVTTTSFRYSIVSSRSFSYYACGYALEVPDSEKIYRYICVATSVKTPVEVNIDNVITDLNEIRSNIQNVATRPYVTEEWHEGSNWYRVWSTGFIEQGGQLASWTNNPILTVTLPTSFTSTNYTIHANTIGVKNDEYTGQVAVVTANKTTSSFQLSPHTNGREGMYWTARGY